jgi:hypothetical protein
VKRASASVSAEERPEGQGEGQAAESGEGQTGGQREQQTEEQGEMGVGGRDSVTSVKASGVKGPAKKLKKKTKKVKTVNTNDFASITLEQAEQGGKAARLQGEANRLITSLRSFKIEFTEFLYSLNVIVSCCLTIILKFYTLY